jgi:hypothetical protein
MDANIAKLISNCILGAMPLCVNGDMINEGEVLLDN